MNPLLALRECGQSVSLDDITRRLITGGTLQRLIDDDGLAGLTSNPTIFQGGRFALLTERGARVQRPLWASTGTKNTSYSDVLYLESLVAPDTVTTVPPQTMDAFRDHGRVRVTLGTEETDAEATVTLDKAATLGVDVRAIAEQLQVDGIAAFASSFEQLIATVGMKRRELLTPAS